MAADDPRDARSEWPGPAQGRSRGNRRWRPGRQSTRRTRWRAACRRRGRHRPPQRSTAFRDCIGRPPIRRRACRGTPTSAADLPSNRSRSRPALKRRATLLVSMIARTLYRGSPPEGGDKLLEQRQAQCIHRWPIEADLRNAIRYVVAHDVTSHRPSSSRRQVLARVARVGDTHMCVSAQQSLSSFADNDHPTTPITSCVLKSGR